MNSTDTKQAFIERLRRCPKLECNFWSRLNPSIRCGGEVSDKTYENGDFGRKGNSSLLFLAAKRFENNLFDSNQSSEHITTELYDEDRLVPSFSDIETPLSSTSGIKQYTEPKYNIPSYNDVAVDETTNYGEAEYNRIPNLRPIREKNCTEPEIDRNCHDDISADETRDYGDPAYDRIPNLSPIHQNRYTEPKFNRPCHVNTSPDETIDYGHPAYHRIPNLSPIHKNEYKKPKCDNHCYEQISVGETRDYGDPKYDRIPNLDPIHESNDSLSSSSTRTISTGGSEQEEYTTNVSEMDDIYENMITASITSSSFDTPGRIPNPGPIHESNDSLSRSSTRTISTGGSEREECTMNVSEMDDIYEIMINASVTSSSFTTPTRNACVSSLTDALTQPKNYEIGVNKNGFIDVKNARSLNLFVDDYPESSFFSLLESLQSNREIERIIISRQPMINQERRKRSVEDMENLFYIIKNHSHSLLELVLRNFHMEDLLGLRLGLEDQSSIGHLHLHMELGTLDQELVECIASMPSLVELELDLNESFPVSALLRSSSLTVLGVISTRFHFESNDVLRLARSLRTNSALKVLDLEPRIPRWCLGSMMASLRFSHCTKLEVFLFSCHTDNEEQGDSCMAELVKTIESDTCLRVLWNHSYKSFSISSENRSKSLLAMRCNTSLEQCRVFDDESEE